MSEWNGAARNGAARGVSHFRCDYLGETLRIGFGAGHFHALPPLILDSISTGRSSLGDKVGQHMGAVRPDEGPPHQWEGAGSAALRS